MYNDEQKQLAINLRKQGFTYKEICLKTGIKNQTTVHNLCYDAGLPKNPYPKRFLYCSGERFHNFVIIGASSLTKTDKGNCYTRWECLCDCGNKFITTTKQIRKGIKKSCGCLSFVGRFKKGDGNRVIGKIRFDNYRAGAKRRNLEWKLTLDEFIKMLYSNCEYCGSAPYILVKRSVHERKVNGIDRINSDLGYFSDNCVPCCKFCNMAKGNSTKKEFLKWIGRLKNHENSSNQ